MKKIILIASLLMVGGLWAEVPQVCEILATKEKTGLQQTLELGCREGDALMWTAPPSLAQHWIARYCLLDKPIVIINEEKGVCTFRGGSLVQRPFGVELKKFD